MPAPKGTIGVGYPGDVKDPSVSAQISGIVTPGVVSVTGVNPSFDLDLSKGSPSGTVYFENLAVSEVPEEVSVLEASLEQVVDPNLGQAIWPTLGSRSMDNPLKVDIQLIPGAPSVIPPTAVPAFGGEVGLMLQLGDLGGQGDNGQLVYVMNNNYRKYYEILSAFRLNSVDPATPAGFYAYHPLSDADTSAMDEGSLDAGAYDFIDGNLNYDGDYNPFYDEGKKKNKS